MGWVSDSVLISAGTKLVYTYHYHEMKIILDGTFIISDETGKEVTATKGDVSSHCSHFDKKSLTVRVGLLLSCWLYHHVQLARFRTRVLLRAEEEGCCLSRYEEMGREKLELD